MKPPPIGAALLLAATVFSATTLPAAAADQALSDSVDRLVNADMQQQRIPGYALAVIQNGDLVLARGYGLADMARRKPVTVHTVFGLASLTKTFTALMLLMLVDGGKLQLDDPLVTYVGPLPDNYQRLRLWQLATMTAGIPARLPRTVDWRNQLPILVAEPLLWEPGSGYEYSNFSYRLLGSVIETITQKSFFQSAQDMVLTPLGMQTTGTTVTMAATRDVARAYEDSGRAFRPVKYKSPAVSQAAGMLAGSLEDMVKYVRALLLRQLLSRAGYETMWFRRPPLPSGQPSPWAYGWASKVTPQFGNRRIISMNGGDPGIASSIFILPESNSAVIALCNLRKPQVYALTRKVARLAFNCEIEEEKEERDE